MIEVKRPIAARTIEKQVIGDQVVAVADRLVSAVREWAVSAIVIRAIRKIAVPVAADEKVSNGEASEAAVSAAVDPGAVSHVRQAIADAANGPPAVVTAPKVRPITIKLRVTVRTADRVANTPTMPVDRTTTPNVAQIVAVQIVAVQIVAVQIVAVQIVAVQIVAVQIVAVQIVAVQIVAVQIVAVQIVAVQIVAVQIVAVQIVAVQIVAVQIVAVQIVAVRIVAVRIVAVRIVAVRIVAVRIVVAQNAVVLVALVEVLTGLDEIGPIATTVAMRPAPPTSCSRSCSEPSTARLLSPGCNSKAPDAVMARRLFCCAAVTPGSSTVLSK